jgi:hypothetical protein
MGDRSCYLLGLALETGWRGGYLLGFLVSLGLLYVVVAAIRPWSLLQARVANWGDRGQYGMGKTFVVGGVMLCVVFESLWDMTAQLRFGSIS